MIRTGVLAHLWPIALFLSVLHAGTLFRKKNQSRQLTKSIGFFKTKKSKISIKHDLSTEFFKHCS
jgi:hypothetical protein